MSAETKSDGQQAKLFTVTVINKDKSETPIAALGSIGSPEDVAAMQSLIQDAAIEASELSGVGCQVTDEAGKTVLYNNPEAAKVSSGKTYGFSRQAKDKFEGVFGGDHPGRMGYNLRKKLRPQ